MAVTILNCLQRGILQFAGPMMQAAVPKGYERWIPIVIGWVAKSIAISIAWYLQTIISAVTSAMEGSLIVSRTALKLCVKKGVTLGGLIPQRHEDTYVDEAFGLLLAVWGVCFQFRMGFAIPFPFNLPLLPFEFAESYLRWVITKAS